MAKNPKLVTADSGHPCLQLIFLYRVHIRNGGQIEKARKVTLMLPLGYRTKQRALDAVHITESKVLSTGRYKDFLPDNAILQDVRASDGVKQFARWKVLQAKQYMRLPNELHPDLGLVAFDG